MGKYTSNVFGYIYGFYKMVFYRIVEKKIHIGLGLRLFRGAELSLYRHSKVKIDDNVKIDKLACVVCTKEANLKIGANVGIGFANRIICRNQITIGEGTILGPNVLVYDHDHIFDKEHGVNRTEFITSTISIGRNCWIGAGSIILKGTVIGNNCVIGAGSVIKGIVPEGTLLIQKRQTAFE